MSISQDSIASSKSPRSQSQAASTEFEYATLGLGEFLFPAIEVKVVAVSGKVFPVRMLPDSGATRSVFPRHFAEPFGIDLEECEAQKVDTGNGFASHHLASDPLSAMIADREIELKACFGNIGVPVLGREDFFAKFLVEVDEFRRVVVITPHP